MRVAAERASDDQANAAAATPTATVQRVTAVLDAFLAGAGSDIGITELAAQLGLGKSVVHRLVTALSDADYLSHDVVTRRYSLGPKAVRLGLVAVGQINVRERALPYLRALASDTGETVTLSLRTGDHRTYAEQVESTHRVRQAIQIGSAAPLYVGASGKAILAFLSLDEQEAVLRRARKTVMANGSPLDMPTLKDDLRCIRQRGFATSVSERIVGAASAAAPVFDHHGAVVASISVAGVTVRHTQDDLTRFGEKAATCAERLSADLGWSGSRAAS